MEAKAEGPLNNNEIDIQNVKVDKLSNVEPTSNNEGILSSVSNNKGMQKDDIMSSVSNMYNNAKDSISTYSATNSVNNIAANASIDNAKEAIADMLNVNENILYLIILLVVIAIIVGYFLYYAITDNILYQQKIEVEGTEVPIICNSISEFKISKSLINSNGIKRTYGFWIYINDITKYQGNKYRHVAHIGKSHKEIKNATPYIYLDGYSNKMYVRFATKNEDNLYPEISPGDGGLNSYTSDVLKDAKLSTYVKSGSSSSVPDADCVITINYVPIQRWVHIVIVVSDVNDGYIHTYIDGELEKSTEKLNLHEHNFENTGNLYVGGSIANSTINTTGFSGLISKFTLYNYDLNKNDVYKEYNKGPINSIFASMGLGAANYGLRNPIYKLNNVN